MHKTYGRAICALILTALLSIDCTSDIFADVVSGHSNSTLYMDVIEIDPNTQISVTVPMLFGFIVNGTNITTDTTEITDDYIYLPNYGVQDGKLTIVTYWNQIRNYSTTMTPGKEDPNDRTGLAVHLNAEIQNVTNTNNWMAVQDTDIDTSSVTELQKSNHKYSLGFMVNDETVQHSIVNINNKLRLVDDDTIVNKTISATDKAKLISVVAPSGETGYTTMGTTLDPAIASLQYILHVGGIRGQYNTIEESEQIGTIKWTVYTDSDLD